ncbi:uncharacterized protein APUU_21218A [Aspergillus puulaauensis]|uniref:Uncharacterized protein n=1 Tax=Aspergillus puulaauensis TaxID=1220207 RepID=A0A7R8AJ49_9EURO|nr:uncharacterized protein APUU_21218A [Aspergillus puulaauensis]BCS20786.1 hypothetical protein APUU_21218A [Aspergillus puulaauensis]
MGSGPQETLETLATARITLGVEPFVSIECETPMIEPVCYRLGRPARRAFYGLRPALRPFRSNATSAIHSQRGPVQSELLRFALTRKSHTENPELNFGKFFTDVFLEQWPLNSAPAPLWTPKPGDPSSTKAALNRAEHLHSLQHFIERNLADTRAGGDFMTLYGKEFRRALKSCERHNTYGDILSFINGIDTRLKRLGSRIHVDFHFLGIYYACLTLSECSLDHHIRRYLAADSPIKAKLSEEESLSLVKGLLSSLQAVSFQDPTRDTSNLLCLINGESQPDASNLHQILHWSRDDAKMSQVEDYLALLAQTGDTAIRRLMWEKYLRSDDSEITGFHSGYVYATSMVRAGKPDDALAALRTLSKRAGNDLPRISEFENLNVLLKDDAINGELCQLVSEEEYTKILYVQISEVEKRLGLGFDDNALRERISDTSTSERPLLTIDGDTSGYESPKRLVAEIRALGCSKYPADLNKIGNLLDEFEGSFIPTRVPSWPGPDAEFYWAPQRSPGGLHKTPSQKSDSFPNTSVLDSGLVKVIPGHSQTPYPLGQTLHLMQLGYLLMKQQSPASKGHSDISPQLEETGYLVTWDRVSGRFLIVFAGVEHGVVNPLTESHIRGGPSGRDAIVEINPLNYEHRLGPDIYIPNYRLEVDPSPDLIFDKRT